MAKYNLILEDGKKKIEQITVASDEIGYVRFASDVNEPLAGLGTVDGGTVAVDDLVLCMKQTDPAFRKVYVVVDGAWIEKVYTSNPKMLIVEEGTLNGDSAWLKVESETDSFDYVKIESGVAPVEKIYDRTRVNSTQNIASTTLIEILSLNTTIKREHGCRFHFKIFIRFGSIGGQGGIQLKVTATSGVSILTLERPSEFQISPVETGVYVDDNFSLLADYNNVIAIPDLTMYDNRKAMIEGEVWINNIAFDDINFKVEIAQNSAVSNFDVEVGSYCDYQESNTILPSWFGDLYLGGTFTGRFAVIDKASKAIVTGYPTFSSAVYAISQDDNYIYLGGASTDYFAVIDKSTKSLVTGYPTFNNTVNSISQDDNYIYLGGSFTTPATRFAVIDKATKALVTGYPTFSNTVSAINQDDNFIYIGGYFTGMFAVIDKASKALVTGYPTFGNNVRSISQDDNYIYLGGQLTGKFAVIDKASKALVTGYPTIDDTVSAINQDDTNIYVGGYFTGKFAVIDKASKALVTGYPTIDNIVSAILPNQ